MGRLHAKGDVGFVVSVLLLKDVVLLPQTATLTWFGLLTHLDQAAVIRMSTQAMVESGLAQKLRKADLRAAHPAQWSRS